MSAPNPVHAVVREQGKEHIPIYPKGFIAIRIVQLVFAVIIMGLSGYSVSAAPLSSNVFILVVSLFTLITSIYHIVAHFGPPQAYNYWATLALDIFLVIMWLSAFAVVAADTSTLSVGIYSGYRSSSRYYSTTTYYVYIFWYTMAASAGLGGLQFILHIISLIIHSIRLHQHRAAGLHCMPGSAPTPGGAVVAAPGGEKAATAGGVAPGFAHVAPAYAPYPGQQPQQPIPVYAGPPPPGAIPVPYGGIPQQQGMPQQQQPQGYPVMQNAYPIQQQGQVPIQTTGGSYQQGPPVPLFAQTTGGSSTIPSQPSGGQQQQQQQQQQQGPQGVVPPQQPTQSELAGNQPVYGQPQN